jgi:DNA-binding XRE family transcriptional regulator
MTRAKPKRGTNNVRELREEILMSKAELARRAGVSPLTIDRVESGLSCRLDTKRKIILALGKKLQEKEEVFPDLGHKQKRSSSDKSD